MRAAALAIAFVLTIAAIPLLLRIDSALCSGQRGRALLDAGRIALVAAAAAVLAVIAGRVR